MLAGRGDSSSGHDAPGGLCLEQHVVVWLFTFATMSSTERRVRQRFLKKSSFNFWQKFRCTHLKTSSTLSMVWLLIWRGLVWRSQCLAGSATFECWTCSQFILDIGIYIPSSSTWSLSKAPWSPWSEPCTGEREWTEHGRVGSLGIMGLFSIDGVVLYYMH